MEAEHTAAPPRAPRLPAAPTAVLAESGGTRSSAPADIRTRVLDAARVIIRRVGTRRMSIVEIGRRADLSRTTIYRYWADVDAIIADLLSRELLGLLADVDLRTDTIEGFAAGIVDFADRVRTTPLLDDIRAHDPDLLTTYVFRRRGSSHDGMLARITPLVRALQAADPRARADDPDNFTAMALLLIQGAVLSAPLVDDILDPEEWRRELVHALIGYLQP